MHAVSGKYRLKGTVDCKLLLILIENIQIKQALVDFVCVDMYYVASLKLKRVTKCTYFPLANKTSEF